MILSVIRRVEYLPETGGWRQVKPAFAKTSRPCPPFCIQPAILAPGVETIAEREVIDYISKMSAGDNSILVVDSRTPDWWKKVRFQVRKIFHGLS